MINYTIIIPHKNSPELLNRCINSIPMREDLEIIVVDDNSQSDKIPTSIRSDVKIIYDQTSLGAGHSRNVGLNHAKGTWILFADCDDFYENNYLSVLDKYISSNYDIIFFDCHYRYNNGKCKTNENIFTKLLSKYLEFNDEHTFYCLKHSINAPWNKMYKKAFIMTHMLSFEEIPIGNDALFVNMASFYTNNVIFLSDKLYYYVDNPNGITRTKSRPLSDMKKVFISAAKVDVIKSKDNAIDLVYPIIWNKTKLYIKCYGFYNTFLLYYLKFSYPNYPLLKSFKSKIIKKVTKITRKYGAK